METKLLSVFICVYLWLTSSSDCRELETPDSDRIVRTMRGRRVALTLSILLPTAVLSQPPPPRFADFPAQGKYSGKNSAVMLRNKDDREFRTRLRTAARQPPNFAGHYILTAWGCGAECLAGALIDANSGEVYWFPNTICCWAADVDDKSRPIEFHLDSRLIIFSGVRNEKEGDDGTHFFEFRDGKFLHLKSNIKTAQSGK